MKKYEHLWRAACSTYKLQVTIISRTCLSVCLLAARLSVYLCVSLFALSGLLGGSTFEIKGSVRLS